MSHRSRMVDPAARLGLSDRVSMACKCREGSAKMTGKIQQGERNWQHSLREPMIDELHARPFLRLKAPCRLAYIALKPEQDGSHTADLSRRQLTAFLARFGAAPPDEDAVYHSADLGDMVLKWEHHSEFATYTLFGCKAVEHEDNFAHFLHRHFAAEWLNAFDGKIISSVTARIDLVPDETALDAHLSERAEDWFGVNATYSAAFVTDQSAAIAADFTTDKDGHMRIAMLANGGIGPGRTGRAMQRMLEIETYRAMSMLTLPVARHILGQLGRLNQSLSETVEAMSAKQRDAGESLEELLHISSDLALLSARSSFRFSAARAYETLVRQRIELLREERILGRQMFAEFMKRRYSPSMRTCHSAHAQLEDISDRTAHAADLLSTRVSVTTAEQNRNLLAKMDTRAAQQARLQETVEGISVVAISYYAVSLLSYLLAPLTKMLPVSKTMLSAALVIPVVLLVWTGMHRLKKRLIREPNGKIDKTQ
ncbi:DUF3422 domain-containing protein [Cohaesibacter sp. CAU 1516]|nr:DUF3422 domain-containing protein [Cohaesibacter sp. CAU 1516]